MAAPCRTGPTRPLQRATTFLIQPNVKSQPLDESLKCLTAPGPSGPRSRHLARLAGSPAHEAESPPSGRCWERRTIDLGKSATDAGSVTAPDCPPRLSPAPHQRTPSTAACVTARKPVLSQGHNPDQAASNSPEISCKLHRLPGHVRRTPAVQRAVLPEAADGQSADGSTGRRHSWRSARRPVSANVRRGRRLGRAGRGGTRPIPAGSGCGPRPCRPAPARRQDPPPRPAPSQSGRPPQAGFLRVGTPGWAARWRRSGSRYYPRCRARCHPQPPRRREVVPVPVELEVAVPA